MGAGFAIADGVRSSGLAGILSQAIYRLLGPCPLFSHGSYCMPHWRHNNRVHIEQRHHHASFTATYPNCADHALDALLLMVPGSIGAKFSFLIPSNIVGFTIGHIEIKDMVRTGLPLKISGIAALSILMPTLVVIVFGTEKLVPT
ncbi:tonoplast dicarboxylate transporter-like [Actinidia eriantha]|uniref:tonoplast dicarboxylate transporter-like n=1 Tax=Actinidia eriantha TaxID=165200 RepID=UPI00259123B4|nr:tonoplast dicarboxylate transporter-like [Actinidia eriantha]